ncbi:MAG: hypothetical protein NT002_00060 [candidate division Zixibacteria bacterium]|nr:hypothetical protein [candidate division Zixibacteria bacterium]
MKRVVISICFLISCWLALAAYCAAGNALPLSATLTNNQNVLKYIEGTLSDPVAAGDEAAASLRFFENNKGGFKMADPATELRLKKTEVDEIGMKHLRFQQYYKGIRVIGGELVTHFTSSGSLKTVNGAFYPEINLETLPAKDAADAVTIAGNDLSSFFGTGKPGEAELAIFPWEDKYYLTWRLFLYSDTPMGRWEYFVDAVTGEVIYKANRIMNANDIGTGIGVMGNALTHIDTHYDGSTYHMVDYTRQLNNNPHGHNGQMPSGNYLQTNIAGWSLPGSVATDADNQWSDPSQAPAVSGHTYTALMYDWLLSSFNRNSYNDSGASMLTVVDYARCYDNAYWNGSFIYFCGSSFGWRSLAGCPDVMAHEWAHAVTDYESNLNPEKEPGALWTAPLRLDTKG